MSKTIWLVRYGVAERADRVKDTWVTHELVREARAALEQAIEEAVDEARLTMWFDQQGR